MQIERIAISKLVGDPANARKHGERNIETIVQSLNRFGQQKPIVVDSSFCVRAGNGTLEAARSLGWTHIDCVVTDLKGSDAIAYAIADNRTAELAEWDSGVLAATLEGLQFDDEALLAAAGFSDDELAELLKGIGAELGDEGGGGVTEDEVPEPPVDPITKPGDLWILGNHRLLCGDATKAEDVQRLMDGQQVELWLTDPPYNVDYTGKTKDALKVANDSMADQEFRSFLVKAFSNAFSATKPGAAFYIWHADLEGFNFRGAVHDCAQRVRQCLIWNKNIMVMGRQDYHWKHEPCLYGWKDGAAHAWYSDRKQTTVLNFDRPSRSEQHPTMKPVALFVYLIANSSGHGSSVLDTFAGSGTTLIACEQLNRTCYGMELSPQYCDVIVNRWENLTGQTAVCQSATQD